MKKFFLMLAVVAGCAVFTSCKSDAEKAAQLLIDAQKAAAEGNMEEVLKLKAEADKIAEANKDNEDFEKQVEEAYNKLKEADKK